jgi:polyhydroxybutyrate depolymerase
VILLNTARRHRSAAWLLVPIVGACSRTPPAPDSRADVATGTSRVIAPTAPSPTSPAPTSPLKVPPAQIYEPELTDGERAPLLVFLHGLGSSGKLGFDLLGLKALGGRERSYVIAPDGSIDTKGRHFWNAHPACCDFDRQEVDDVARLRHLIVDFSTQHAVDARRVYIVGYSNGGFMAHRLACHSSDRIAAFVSIAGASPVPGEACAIAAPLAALEIHGDADDVVSYHGGRLFQRPALVPHASAPQTLAFWADRLGCTGKANAGPDFDLDPGLPGAETRTQSHDDCKLGIAALWTVRGGTHLVGARQKLLEQVWQFLSSHRKRDLP